MPSDRSVRVVGFGAHNAAIGDLVHSAYTITPPSERPADSSPGLGPLPPHLESLATRRLCGVVSIDESAGTALVQARCPFTQVVKVLAARGLMPLDVPATAGRTLGGAISRTSVGSAAFRVGQVGNSVLEMELLAPSGDVIDAKPDGPNQEVFAGIVRGDGPGDHVIISARLAVRAVPAFVATRQIGFASPAELQEAMGSVIQSGGLDGEPVDFIEAVCAPATGPVMSLGRLVGLAEAPHHAVTPSRYCGSGPTYADSLTPGSTDLLTLSDYLTRWEPDGYWRSARYGLRALPVRKIWPARLRGRSIYDRLDRFWDGPGQGLDQLIRQRSRTPRVFCEVAVPLDKFAQFAESVATIAPGLPIWMAPLQTNPADAATPPTTQFEAYCGLWGPGAHQKTGHNPQAQAALVEATTQASGHPTRPHP